ncbi:MAG TPA: ectonucleotide pyrophosphatase/phosphodiesterase [Rhodanobacteraceae bacterium]|jgi:predicted AlkP superfamily pyrophosphatase or phosphodiesterase|nr:ectonucleotide pyrophosphatase/phosphodiesterase [Rhodanobacteraceae bacterium]
MSAAGRTLFLIAVLIVAACAGNPASRNELAAPAPVILISIDGFRADYLDRSLTPTLLSLAADGVRADALKPAFPTLTFPNHYTLVTGLYPDHHGIVDNRMMDPATGKQFVYKDAETIADPKWWGGEPLWVSVEKQGHHAATMFWPGSDVAIEGVRPSHWLHFDATLPPDQRVDQLLDWMDLRGSARPVFYTLYLNQVDHAGHDYGPDSAEVNQSLGETDAALARLVEGLKRRGVFESTNLVIVSDHGMTATSPERVIYLDDLINAGDADVVTYGILAGINPKPASNDDAARAVLSDHAHMRCWRKSAVPARLHYGTNARIPALLCLADDGWIITSHESERTRTHFSLGEHGYDNDDPAMRALFVAHGPAFKKGLRVAEFDNVDVYPLLAHLLAITPAANDGNFAVVSPMLRQAR